jgi:hypothetical protein
MNIKKLSFLLLGGVTLLVSIYAGLLIYAIYPMDKFSLNKSGVFGDSFGLLTSLFSGLAFAGLIITILMQKEEISLQREDLKLTRNELNAQKQEMKTQNATLKTQQFESTFFNLLNLLRSNINELTYLETYIRGTDSVGFEALSKICTKLIREFYDKDPNVYSKAVLKTSCKTLDGVGKKFRSFLSAYEHTRILIYLRTLKSILILIDDSAFPNAKKIFYFNILKVQLSSNELMLLFYSGLATEDSKIIHILKKYDIFEFSHNLSIPPEHKTFLQEFKKK